MKYYDQISAYLSDQLSEEQRTAFEAAMSSDAELTELVRNFPEVNILAEGLLEMQLLNEVQHVSEISNKPNDSKNQKNNTHKRNWKKIFFLAFLAMVSVELYSILTNSNDDKKKEETKLIWAEVYKEPIWPIKRSGEKNYVNKGVSQYLSGDHKGGKKILLDSVMDKTIGKYWLSELFLSEGKIDSSLLYLPSKKINKHLDSRVLYLKVISYLEKGDKEEAQKWAKSLSPDYFNKLKEFLD